MLEIKHFHIFKVFFTGIVRLAITIRLIVVEIKLLGNLF